MSEFDSVPSLLARVQTGSQNAAAEVYERFARRLIALARTRLNHRLKQKVDPEDIVQSVFKSFFVRQAVGEYDLRSADSLWGLLALITIRKCSRKAVHYFAARRDAGRDVGQPASDEASRLWEALSQEPTPEQAALLSDTVERLMQALDPREREILALSLQGVSSEEIASQVQRSERTVRRVMEFVRTVIEKMRLEDE
jgi:RNA polymerase sigma-70 factor (ECF subfamily)